MKQQIVVLSLGLLLTGCAAIEADEYAVADPYEGFNRGSYAVTDKVDRAVLQPVAQGYERITPGWLAGGILNIFENLRSLPSGINGFLQGKPKSGATDLTRLVVNSTIGIGGFFDVASRWNLAFQDEDFGQTLAVWGVKRTRYVYVPLLGPSTWRDLPSTVVRSALPRLLFGDDYHWAISVVDVVSARADLLSATEVRDATAIDPYAFTRDAYYQRRKFLIYDGRPPLDELFEEFEEFEEYEDPDDLTE